MRALVVGGDIGGLAAAIALRRVGLDVTVFEQAHEFERVGYGFGLSPNALLALDPTRNPPPLRASPVAHKAL